MCSSALAQDRRGEKRGRTGNISLWSRQWIRVRSKERERDIKFGVIRHNTLLSLYHTALHSSARSFMMLWEGAEPMAQSVYCCKKKKSLSLKELSIMLFPLITVLTLLYLKQPVWHWTWLNLSEAKPRYSSCLRGSASERAESWPGESKDECRSLLNTFFSSILQTVECIY